MMEATCDLTLDFATLLREAGISALLLNVKNCTQGKNNRTYQVQTAEGPYIVKQYLRQAGDKRDRLTSEFSFLSYAESVIPKAVPKPLYQNKAKGVAVYGFIEGKPFTAQELSRQDIEEAARFFCALNQPSARAGAQHLAQASEACFSIQEHLELVTARIQALEAMKAETAEDQKALELIAALSGHWLAFTEKLQQSKPLLELNRALAPTQRCISPSDFGFHNALKRPDGSLCFLDFEYAGWDDPAKMCGDFFSQLAVPVPATYFNDFVSTVMQPFSEPESLIQRAHLLRLVYRIKWCCIALNIFLPVHLSRYQFSNPTLAVAEFKRTQLVKVATLIQSLESLNHGLH